MPWIKRTDREPKKTGKYKIRYALNDFNDECGEAEEMYFNETGWNKHGYAQFVIEWWEEPKVISINTITEKKRGELIKQILERTPSF